VEQGWGRAGWGPGRGGDGVTAFGHSEHPCVAAERLWPIHLFHKAAQVSAAHYDPGKLPPSNEPHTGGKQ